MIAPARIAAYQVLSAVSAGRSDLPSALASARGSLTDERDRALVSEIATGVQRRRATLDHLIVHFSRRTLDQLDPELVEILRLSIYQLLHLTRVPAAAVVDDAVDLVRRAGKQSAGGFANAVLRSISRQRHSLPIPSRPERVADRDPALDYLSITLSHPHWIASRWYDRLGFDRAEQWLAFNNTPAPMTLRVNRLRTTPGELTERLAGMDVAVSRGRFAPDALLVDSGNPLRVESDGSFVVQDEASQLVALLAGASPGRWVLDACASPGGKATAVAAALGANGTLVACDVRERRLDLLRRTIRLTRSTNILVAQVDLVRPLPFAARFDCVIVDAPCSGLGILRSDPDIRWRRQPADLAVLAASQLQMLRHASEVVAPGGRLVYATCSSEPEENEDVVDRFLQGTPAFAEIHARHAHPELPAAVVDSRGHLRTTPDLHQLGAFFGAVLERHRAQDL